MSNGTAKRLKNHALGGKDSKGPGWSTYVGPCRRRRKGEETAKNLLLPSDVQFMNAARLLVGRNAHTLTGHRRRP